MLIRRLAVKYGQLFLGIFFGIAASKFFTTSSKSSSHNAEEAPNYSKLPILINGEAENQIIGIRNDESDEVYFPWIWVKSFFDVFGDFGGEKDQFVFKNSYSEMNYKGDKEYTPNSSFMTFENYRVESRERVKLISGVEGVPFSTQWSPEGYFYPVQIAQYGLAAYSRNVTTSSYDSQSYTPSCGSKFEQDLDPPCSISTFQKHSNSYLTVCYEQLLPGSSIIVDHSPRISTSDSKERTGRVEIHYIANKVPEEVPMIEKHEKRGYAALIVIGIGERNEPGCISRDILNDALKGLGKRNQKSVRRFRGKMDRINSIRFEREGIIKSVKLAKTGYLEEFKNAAIWLRDHQTENGTWPIDVGKERVDYPDLVPGWTSAMAQGHGISMMVRAANSLNDPSFWVSAGKALEPFKKRPKDKGVRNLVFDKHVWYEEYPFEDGLFVLNGFIYSLIGLYDLAESENAPPTLKFEASTLFEEGLLSLKTLLPLFDAGKGSFYDLGHVVKKTSPNLARWDYHTVHVQQLRLLNSFLDDPVIESFALRWEEYTKGNYASHN
ncbi:Oidioi.mRNA.OKI2018_I69.chr1.g1152.t1.cds [Oikopleura dioica]|uniref:Oidioi.mRNA.OKI2018_I69.chr1.g1152.t1.cds n=1 Tax=Oikopleura dioica TaxID=34765 RepID=A0ABN7SS90_OIKDI|nr:Oidioi.mRNA.OKI2018_I69.chr1.g1152.t1.cds [Oikopleura dioica]